MTRRKLRPRPTQVVLPFAITDDDASCFPVIGLTARRLREFVRTFAIPHARLGRRLVVRLTDIDEALSRQVGTVAAERGDDEFETSVDHVLERVGRRKLR